MSCETYMKLKFQCPSIKFYLNAAPVIHLHIACCCIPVTTEMRCHNRGTINLKACSAYCLALHRKSMEALGIDWLNHWSPGVKNTSCVQFIQFTEISAWQHFSQTLWGNKYSHFNFYNFPSQTFHEKMGRIKDKMARTSQKQKRLRRSGKNMQKNYMKKVLMTQITMMVWSLT